MRVITTIFNQVLVSVVWLVFTHYFLTPKENNWRSQILSDMDHMDFSYRNCFMVSHCR